MRSFSVVAAGTQSLQHELTIGVPQGLLLCYLYFSQSLEEVKNAHNMQFHPYADDTQLYLNFQPDNKCENQANLNKLQCCLTNINAWMKHHFLKLNLDKTEVMEVSIYPNYFPKVFNSFSILVDKDTKLNFNVVTRVINLGFIIDD